MTTMIKSPFQPNDYVRKGEFNEFQEFVRDGFESMGELIGNVESKVDKLANKVDKLELKVDESEKRIIAEFNRTAGIMYESTSHQLKAALEQTATKEDLKGFATKEDLKQFATKEDLKAYATKDDLVASENRIVNKLLPYLVKNGV